MPDARFEVELHPREDGCGPRGADAVELMIAANPGVPAGPLREIASGGELSRVMLALLSVAHGDAADGGTGGPLLVFDEIDAGIGGHTARAVGEHLRDLSAGPPGAVHHPPAAGRGARRPPLHDRQGHRHRPGHDQVTELGGNAIVGELVRMLGAGEGDRAAKQHARQLLKAAA